MSTTIPYKAKAARSGQRRVWLCGLLVGITLLAYLPSYSGQFLFDDVDEIVANERLRSWSGLGSLMKETRRPVVYASLGLNYLVGGLQVGGYHVVNGLVHIACGLVLFSLVGRTLRLPQYLARYADSADAVAFAVAAIWLIHPLQTQAVTYIVQRCESLMGLSFLLAVYGLLRGVQRRSRLWMMVSMVAVWVGMGCKEVMIAAPAVLLLYDRVFLAASWGQLVRQRWRYYAAILPPVTWLIWASFAMRESSVVSAGFGCTSVTLWEYLRSQPGVIVHYLRLVCLPDRLCLDYQWPVASGWRETLLPAALVVSMLLGCLAAFRIRPAVGFLGLSCFLVLAPTSSVMPIADLAVEHRMYLPLAPLAILFVLGATRVIEWFSAVDSERARQSGDSAPRYRPTAWPGMGSAQACGRRITRSADRRFAAVCLLGLLLVVLGMRTFARNQDYQDPCKMWALTLQSAPHNDRAANNLAFSLRAAGQHEQALEMARRAIEQNPANHLAHGNLAGILQEQGDTDGAFEHWRRAVEVRSDFSPGHYALAALHAGRGDWTDAIARIERVLELQPDFADAHHKLAFAYTQTNQLDAAIQHLRHAIQLAPDRRLYRSDLSRLLGQQSTVQTTPMRPHLDGIGTSGAAEITPAGNRAGGGNA